jgi:hypothetical protein
MSEYARNLDTYGDGGEDMDDYCTECGGVMDWIPCTACGTKENHDPNCPDCDSDCDMFVCSECGELGTI